MKKRIIICLYTIAFIILAKLLFTYFYNENLNKKYESGDYNSFYDMLTYVNYPESYKAYYNNANVYYRREDYGKAADLYRQALQAKPKHKKGNMDECLVRINLALSMVKGLGEDYAIPEKREESISVLLEARDVLLENGCATEADDGHSAKAEKLKKEIERLIDELENMDKNENMDGSGNGGQGQGQGGSGQGSGSGNTGDGQGGNSGGEGSGENGDDQSKGNDGNDKEDGSGQGNEDSENENGGGDDGNQGNESGDNSKDKKGDQGSDGKDKGDNDGGHDDGNNKGDEKDQNNGKGGGGLSPDDQAEEDMRGRLMDQQEKNNREREEGMGSLDEWNNWDFSYDEEIW